MAKKENIKRLFDNIAPDYDKLNHILSLNIDKGWRKKAVREIVDTNSPLTVLDVACGTGDFTIEIAKKAAQGSVVKGIDLSEGMMQVGRDKIKAADVDATLEYGDCEVSGNSEVSGVTLNQRSRLPSAVLMLLPAATKISPSAKEHISSTVAPSVQYHCLKHPSSYL